MTKREQTALDFEVDKLTNSITLGAMHIDGRIMIIDTRAAATLVDKYFKTTQMKRNKPELDVDFIGGEGPLTKEEEKAISAFLQSSKQKTPAGKRSTRPENDKSTAERTKVGR